MGTVIIQSETPFLRVIGVMPAPLYWRLQNEPRDYIWSRKLVVVKVVVTLNAVKRTAQITYATDGNETGRAKLFRSSFDYTNSTFDWFQRKRISPFDGTLG